MNKAQTTVLGLEKDYWKAIKDNDSEAIAELTDDPCVVVGTQGVSELRRDDLIRMMAAPSYELRSYHIDDMDMTVRSIGNNMAIVAYKVHEELVVDGEPSRFEAVDSSVWVRRNGKWVCTLHTETPMGTRI